jgi:Carboxypeptidase regulatory-like domain
MGLRQSMTYALHCMAPMLVMCCFSLEGIAVAQDGRGSIVGQVIGLSEEEVPGAPIEAKDLETGNVFKTASSVNGAYSFIQLPLGRYQISSPIAGFEHKEAEVRAGESVRVDIHYTELGGTLGTIGTRSCIDGFRLTTGPHLPPAKRLVQRTERRIFPDTGVW